MVIDSLNEGAVDRKRAYHFFNETPFSVRPVSARSSGWETRICLAVGRVSQRQECPSWGGIWRKPDCRGWKVPCWTNLWPDEQKPHIRLWTRVSLLNKTKPNSCTESVTVNAAGKEGKNVWVPGEVLQAHLSRHNRGKMRSNNELQEVSRSHSTRGVKKSLGRAEQSLGPSRLQKEVSMMNAEYR